MSSTQNENIIIICTFTTIFVQILTTIGKIKILINYASASHKPLLCTQPSKWYGFLTGGSVAGLLFSDFSGVATDVVLATSESISATCSSTSAAVHPSSIHSSAATSTAAAGSMPRIADNMHDAAITDGFFSMNSGSEKRIKKNKRNRG